MYLLQNLHFGQGCEISYLCSTWCQVGLLHRGLKDPPSRCLTEIAGKVMLLAESVARALFHFTSCFRLLWVWWLGSKSKHPETGRCVFRNWQCHFHDTLWVNLKVQIPDLEPCFKTSTVRLRMWTKSECIGTGIYLPTITEHMETMGYGARV